MVFATAADFDPIPTCLFAYYAQEKEDANGGKAYTPPEHSMETLDSSTVTQPQPGPMRDDGQDDSPNIQRHRSLSMENVRFDTRDGPSASKATGVRPEPVDVSAAADPELRVEADASECVENIIEEHERAEGAVHARSHCNREQARDDHESRVEADASEPAENVLKQRDGAEGDGCSAATAKANNFAAEAAAERVRELLSAIPVDLEKLRNLSWEPGGYQVRIDTVWVGSV